ncbi:MAG: hypothetical protein ACTHNS_02270 [Marmoricola sp.]
MRPLRVPLLPRTLCCALAGAVSCAVLAAGCGGSTTPTGPRSPTGPVTTAPSPTASTPLPSFPGTPKSRPSPLPSPARLRAAPPTGPVLAGTGYRFRVPAGWRDVTGTLDRTSGVDEAAGAREAVDGFNSNVNVVVTHGALTTSQVITVTASIRDRIRPTAPHYAVRQPVLIDGETAGHLAGLRSRAKPPYWLEQLVVSHGSHAYVVSFSFSPRLPASRRERLVASVLAGWSWR